MVLDYKQFVEEERDKKFRRPNRALIRAEISEFLKEADEPLTHRQIQEALNHMGWVNYQSLYSMVRVGTLKRVQKVSSESGPSRLGKPVWHYWHTERRKDVEFREKDRIREMRRKRDRLVKSEKHKVVWAGGPNLTLTQPQKHIPLIP